MQLLRRRRTCIRKAGVSVGDFAGGCPPPIPSPLSQPSQVRLYRVRWFFRFLEYDLTLSLLWVTVARNLLVSGGHAL